MNNLRNAKFDARKSFNELKTKTHRKRIINETFFPLMTEFIEKINNNSEPAKRYKIYLSKIVLSSKKKSQNYYRLYER